MPNPNRRTVLRGAGIAFGASVAAVGVAGPAAAQPDPDPQDLAHLRRTFVLAEQARQAGGAPYGALVADAAGNVVSEHGNTSSVDGGDPTDHAEMVTVRSAWRALGDDGMRSATLYASTEPCTMCAGASVLSRVARLVFGAYDPKAGAVASLFDVVRDPRLNHRPEVIGGVRAQESDALLTAFFAGRR